MPLNVTSMSSVTVIPDGITMSWPETVPPGAIPPHVAALDQLPDDTAVKAIAEFARKKSENVKNKVLSNFFVFMFLFFS